MVELLRSIQEVLLVIIDFLGHLCYIINMSTVSVSLPKKLQEQTSRLVKEGYYSSVSEVVRAGIRVIVQKSKYDLWAEEAVHDLKNGDALVLNDAQDIDKLFD